MHLIMKAMMLAIALISIFHVVHSQNPAFTQSPANTNGNTGTNIFYLVSNSDCNGAIRELFASTATIKGSDPTSSRQGPTTCTIKLRSTGQYDTTYLEIDVVSMNILDCTTQVSIYDGDGAQKLMMTADCRSNQNINRRSFITSGNTASFMMSRPNIDSVNFDIEIIVKPVRGGVSPDTNFADGYYFDKFTQAAIVGMIGAFYAVILAICTAIIIYCSRNYWGLNKTWETHELATVKTGTTFDLKSQPSNVWSVGMKQSQGRANHYPSTIAPTNSRRNVAPNEDGDSGVYYNDDVFQKRRLMNDEKDIARSRVVLSNASFAEPEDKIITPKVNLGNKRNKRPPSYTDAVSDRTSDSSSDQESDVSSSNHSVKKHISDEGASDSSRTSKSETQSDTESEEDSGSEYHRSHRGTRTQKHKKVPDKNRQRDTDGSSRPNRSQQQPVPAVQLQQIPYGTYSSQFVPMMAGPQFQQVPIIPSYPPTYQQNLMLPQPPQVQPTEPPVYSYLVRRGYTPLEAHSNSTASTQASHRSGGGQLEEPELRLDSGVEYMRR